MIANFFRIFQSMIVNLATLKISCKKNTNKQSNNQGICLKFNFLISKNCLQNLQSNIHYQKKSFTNFFCQKKNSKKNNTGEKKKRKNYKIVKQCGVLVQLSDTPCEKSTAQKHKVCPYIYLAKPDPTLGKMFQGTKRIDQMKWMASHASVLCPFKQTKRQDLLALIHSFIHLVTLVQTDFLGTHTSCTDHGNQASKQASKQSLGVVILFILSLDQKPK